MAMKEERKRALREEYDRRQPDMGVVCWESGGRMWLAVSKDAKADYNRSLFQLRLGSWPNGELQRAFTADPDSFHWSLLKKLEYEEREEDHSDELEILYLLCREEYPQAQAMRPGRGGS